MSYRVMAPEFETLVDRNEAIRTVAGGFIFTEGPIWHPTGHYLLFSDMPGDVRRRWDAEDGVREVRRPANKCNGMTYDADLNLIVCEHATSSLIRETPAGGRQVLASHFEGQELNSPNDVCVRSDGSIYFSDPWYGRMPGYGVERDRQLGWQGVFRLTPDGKLHLVVPRHDFAMPNGLCFSPDEKLLYINDTENGLIRVYEVAANGVLRHGRIFAEGMISQKESGVPDGMKCDERGNIWCTGPGGVWVFSPEAELLGRIAVPEVVGNLHWGGADFKTLFLAASTSIYSLRTKVGPRPEPFMHKRRAPAAGKQTGAKQESEAEAETGSLALDPARCALIIQDLQNDVISEGGAFASSGAPGHATRQKIVQNVGRLARACRSLGIPVIHVWFVVDPGAPGMTLNAPLFQSVRGSEAMIRGSWGAAPVAGLEPEPGDFVVEKMRMSAWEGTRLETILKALNRDVIINTGAWTNMSVEHTARTGADKGYVMIVPEDACSTVDEAWQRASIDFALRNVATITTCRALEEVMASQ